METSDPNLRPFADHRRIPISTGDGDFVRNDQDHIDDYCIGENFISLGAEVFNTASTSSSPPIDISL